MSKIDVSNMDLYYGDFHALKNINLSIDANEVTAFIGPSGCGKSTLLKSINRMNDLVPGCRITGEMLLDGENIYGGKMDVNGLRKRVAPSSPSSCSTSCPSGGNAAFGDSGCGIYDFSEGYPPYSI